MAKSDFMRFLIDLSNQPEMLAAYGARNAAQLVFHAKGDGYDFGTADMVAVRGALEANVILNIHKDPFDGSARLWREMWGKPHLDYLVDGVVRLHSEDQLWQLVGEAADAR